MKGALFHSVCVHNIKLYNYVLTLLSSCLKLHLYSMNTICYNYKVYWTEKVTFVLQT